MSNIFSKIFGLKKKDNLVGENELINYAEIVLMGTGEYASNSLTDDWAIWSNKMADDLKTFETYAIKYSSKRLFILTGIGWENFSIWYRRKHEDKTTPLRLAVSMFKEAIKIDPNSEEAKIALASILINRIQVRDLYHALNILKQVNDKSGKVQELIGKAKRWIGEIKLNSNFDYAGIELLPLNHLREERKKCRALIRSLKKEDNKVEIEKVLVHMYRIAVLHDIATYLMWYCGYFVDPEEDRVWDEKLHVIAKNISKYSFKNNGKLIESGNCFFSNNDYKTFEMIFGETNKIFNPVLLLK